MPNVDESQAWHDEHAEESEYWARCVEEERRRSDFPYCDHCFFDCHWYRCAVERDDQLKRDVISFNERWARYVETGGDLNAEHDELARRVALLNGVKPQ